MSPDQQHCGNSRYCTATLLTDPSGQNCRRVEDARKEGVRNDKAREHGGVEERWSEERLEKDIEADIAIR